MSEDVATHVGDVVPWGKEVAPRGWSCTILLRCWPIWKRYCTIVDYFCIWCTILILWVCHVDPCMLIIWLCTRNTPCCATMMEVRPLVFMMSNLCIMMFHYGSRWSIMCVSDTHGLYDIDECYRRSCMVEYDWLSPCIGL